MRLSFRKGNAMYINLDITEFMKLPFTEKEKVEILKQELLKRLKSEYAAAVRSTDERVLQYQKRRELGIMDEDDEADYQEALNYYKKITEQYRQKKAKLEQISDIEQLQSFDTSIG